MRIHIAKALRLLWLALALVALPLTVRAEVPPARLQTLSRGINLTNWFRFPAREDDTYLRNYISDRVLAQLKAAGFTFVRLPVQPELMLTRQGLPDEHRLGLVAAAIARIERHGLGVMVNFHPRSWHESFTPVEQWQLQELWGALAQRLRPLSPDLTFPEVLNEPIYPEGVAPWEELQKKVLARIRAELPRETVIVTSNHWSAIDSLPALHPLPDRNLVYTFHIYEPMVLTALGDFDHTLDRSALRHLPFPVMGPNSCAAAESATMQKHTIDAIRFYCSEHWDSAKIQGLIDQAAEWGRRNHVPLVCGEFGASDGLPPATRFAWISAVRRALEERGIGWALWGYDDSMGFHAHPYGSPPAPLNPGLLHALGLDDHV